MAIFECNVQEFYECGMSTFLKKTHYGDEETFYLRSLQYYLPVIMHTTWESHRIGWGVFTIQGFERINKESKNTLSRFNNRTGNLASQNIRRLWDVFFLLWKECMLIYV